jgi:hypothetical protein
MEKKDAIHRLIGIGLIRHIWDLRLSRPDQVLLGVADGGIFQMIFTITGS